MYFRKYNNKSEITIYFNIINKENEEAYTNIYELF